MRSFRKTKTVCYEHKRKCTDVGGLVSNLLDCRLKDPDVQMGGIAGYLHRYIVNMTCPMHIIFTSAGL